MNPLHRRLLLPALIVAGGSMSAHTQGAPARHEAERPDRDGHLLNVNVRDLKWNRIFPEAGDRSSEIAILHEDPRTHATQLLIRVPRNFHVPKHWHSANETHTVVSGTFVMECEGQRVALQAGGFNYTPARMRHEAWTTPSEGALLFITVDSAWDINWVDGPPRPADLVGGQLAPTG